MNPQPSPTVATNRGLENREAPVPAMSVVLVTPDRFLRLRKTVQHLQAQTVHDRLELIIVAPSRKELDLCPSELDGFFGYDVAEVNVSASVSNAKVAGVYKATAPLVVFGEDHNFPEPSWAEALIEAHHQPWVGIGPVLCNANPGAFSWSNFFISYGPWIEPVQSGIAGNLSDHNSSYKRAILLEFGSQLENLMDRDGGLHSALQNRGHRLYVESKARTHHLNFDRLIPSLALRFHAGRAFGATRASAANWSFLRRILYVGGTPLIPLIRFRHVLREVKRTNRTDELLPRILPALVLLLIATAVGEAAGYLFGLGQTYRKLDDYEFSGLSLDRSPGLARVSQS